MNDILEELCDIEVVYYWQHKGHQNMQEDQN